MPDVWIFQGCMGVLRGTDVELRGTDLFSICVTSPTPTVWGTKRICHFQLLFHSKIILKCTSGVNVLTRG